MTNTTRRLCAWSSVLASVILLIAMCLMHIIPPPPPSTGPDGIAALIRDNTFNWLLGGTLLLAGAALYAPLYVAISSEMERMSPHNALLAKCQMVFGMLALPVPLEITANLWMVAAFRPERSAETIQLLSDLGWFLFLTPVVAGLFQPLTMAVAILNDKSPSPTFPRWMGFLSIWIGILILPGGLLTFFKTGPFAWNGLFVFYLGFSAFFVWFVPTIYFLIRADHPDTP